MTYRLYAVSDTENEKVLCKELIGHRKLILIPISRAIGIDWLEDKTYELNKKNLTLICKRVKKWNNVKSQLSSSEYYELDKVYKFCKEILKTSDKMNMKIYFSVEREG